MPCPSRLLLIVLSLLLLWPTSLLAQNSPTEDSTREAAPPVRPVSPEERSPEVENSVVKIFATVRFPDIYRPWTKMAPVDVTGSGVVIEGKRILTSAHVVLYASQVQVQANEEGDKSAATVEAIAPGIDLAVLKLDDASFFDSHKPLRRSNVIPSTTDAVLAYGYPKGGRSLSITKGIVSRIEFTAYNYPVSGLRIQIDAAINPGNSGGPAVVNNRMIGLAFSALTGAQNIGYIVPNEEIEFFLKDIADGHYDGKPALFGEMQTLESATLRKFLKLERSVAGIVVHRPESSDDAYPLKEWDVVTHIGDTPIDDEGMVKAGSLRVQFRYLVQKVARNNKIPMTIVRKGKNMSVEVPVSARRALVLPDLEGEYPSYFVCGPMVFSGATSSFVSGFARGYSGGNMMSALGIVGSPLIKRLGDKPAFDGEQLVVVCSPFFPHKLTKGYGNPVARVVKTVNGIPIRNLKHLVEVLRDASGEYIMIDFDYRYGETLIFPRKELLDSTEEILTDNGLRQQGSADTLAVWNGKP